MVKSEQEIGLGEENDVVLLVMYGTFSLTDMMLSLSRNTTNNYVADLHISGGET